jgi:antitoxin component HigA of HigAB toxin-antitoxin module
MEIRYIGKSKNPVQRYAGHINEPYPCKKQAWIKSLKKRGLVPALHIIEELTQDQDWKEREIYWIAYHKSIGTRLVNQTNGGDAGPDCKGMHLKKTPEAIEKYRTHLAIHNRTPAMREASRRHGQRRYIQSLTGDAGEKLTKEQVLEIRAKDDLTIDMLEKLAKEYGVSKTNIRAIRNRKIWKGV